MDKELEESLNNLGEFAKTIEKELNEMVYDMAKKENKSPKQVIDDLMKKYEGKTRGEIMNEIFGVKGE